MSALAMVPSCGTAIWRATTSGRGYGWVSRESSIGIALINRSVAMPQLQLQGIRCFQDPAFKEEFEKATPDELARYDHLVEMLGQLKRCQTEKVVPTILRWRELGNKITSYGMVIVMRRLRWRTRYQQALMVADWIAQTKIVPYGYKETINRLDLCARSGYDFRATRLFENIPFYWKTEDAYCVMLSMYYSKNMVTQAEDIMDKLRKKGVRKIVPYNLMLCLYKRKGMELQFERMVEEVKATGLALDTSFYNIVLSAKFRSGGISAVEELLAEMEAGGIKQDEVTYFDVAGCCLKDGRNEKAEEFLRKIEAKLESGEFKKLRKTHCKLLVMYGRLRNGNAVDRIRAAMNQVSEHSIEEYICIIEALGKVGRVKEAEQIYLRIGCSYLRAKVHNSLLSVFVDQGLVAKAEALVEHMKDIRCRLDPVTYHHLINMYLKIGEFDNALFTFKRLRHAFEGLVRLQPSVETLVLMLDALAKTGDVGQSEDLVRKWIKHGFPVNVDVFNAVLKVYVKAKLRVSGFSKRMLASGVEPTKETERLLRQLPTSNSAERVEVLMPETVLSQEGQIAKTEG